MELSDKIHEAYKDIVNYPQLVKKLIALGIQSYTVDVASETVLYRFADGVNVLMKNALDPKTVAENFNEDFTIQAIRDNQQGKSDYPTFINDIAKAGVRFYEATLNGNNKRVTYIGVGGSYEEVIPG